MILFTLRCASGHEFEAWFRDGDGFEAQHKAGEITCPECGDAQVEKALMAPHIGRSRDKSPPISPAQMRAALTELRRQVEKNCDYVGERFGEEARRSPSTNSEGRTKRCQSWVPRGNQPRMYSAPTIANAKDRPVRLRVAPMKAPRGFKTAPSAAKNASRSATCSTISSASATSKRS